MRSPVGRLKRGPEVTVGSLLVSVDYKAKRRGKPSVAASRRGDGDRVVRPQGDRLDVSFNRFWEMKEDS